MPQAETAGQPMKIGIAGPITLSGLAEPLGRRTDLPAGYEFPLIADMVLELLRRRHRVSVFTLDPGITSPQTIEGDGLTVHIGRMRSKHRGRDGYASERADLVAAMRRDRCDLIHAHWTYEFALAASAAGQPYVVTAHDSPVDNARLFRSPYWWLRAALAWRVLTPKVHLSAVSPYIVEQITRHYRARNIRVIPNGVPGDLLERPLTRYQESGPTFATILGGWDRLKNGVTAIRAFALARRELPGARLVMFGREYGPGEGAEAYAAHHSISSGIEFAGKTHRSALHDRLLTEVDVLVHPSRTESFGMALVEAMALGVATIAGEQSGAVPWTLDGGRCGLLVDIESASAVAAAMVAVGRDERRRRNLAEIARKHVSLRFRLSKVISAYEDWYQAVLMASPRAVADAG